VEFFLSALFKLFFALGVGFFFILLPLKFSPLMRHSVSVLVLFCCLHFFSILPPFQLSFPIVSSISSRAFFPHRLDSISPPFFPLHTTHFFRLPPFRFYFSLTKVPPPVSCTDDGLLFLFSAGNFFFPFFLHA